MLLFVVYDNIIYIMIIQMFEKNIYVRLYKLTKTTEQGTGEWAKYNLQTFIIMCLENHVCFSYYNRKDNYYSKCSNFNEHLKIKERKNQYWNNL